MGVSVIGLTSPEVWKILGIDIDESEQKQSEEVSTDEEINKDEKETKEQVETVTERMRRD